MGNQQGKLQNQNQNGRPKKMVHWKSAEAPSPPGRPILIPLSDQQPDVVNLRWDRPRLDGGSPITGYTVEHRRMGSPHWVRATPTPVPRCEVSISGLEPGWRYQFRVFAENVVGRSEASDLSDALTVTLQRNAISVPRFVDELQDTQAVEDERIEFRVRVLGQPPPEISWFKDGYEIFSSRRTKIMNDPDASVLIIHQVALTDEGEIKCTATNRAGHVVTKAKLMVQAPPKIRLPRTYEDGLIVEADEVLRLKVGVAGQPPPSVTWLHEGEPIPNAGRFEIINTERNSLLKIDNVQREDRGEYSIKAANHLGEDMTSFLVTVTARPNAPGKVRLNMSFGKSATLSWTAPADDGGCKIGNYIVEYFRVGWNVWLKAATTRQLSTTLNDLIEGSEYKFRVKAENPYGLSDPSEESDVLFIPDPKRGITKPKSEAKLAGDGGEKGGGKPMPPRRKTMSPPRPQKDAATEPMVRSSPAAQRKPKPQLIDNEELHREMSYGTPDQALKMDVRKSPSLSSADLAAPKPESNPLAPATPLSLNINEAMRGGVAASKSPQRSPVKEATPRSPLFLRQSNKKEKEKPAAEKPSPSTDNGKRSLNPLEMLMSSVRKSSPQPRSPSPTSKQPHKKSSGLQRSAEPVVLGESQNVRRFSAHALSPVKNAPALAIAIATTLGTAPQNGNKPKTPSPPAPTTPSIEISAPEALPPQPPATVEASPPPTPPQRGGLANIGDKHDEVYTSNEFMLLVYDKSGNSKVKDKDQNDSFELDLEDALQPPPISISAPDLVFTNLRTFPLRRCVSSTELLFQREFARFYEAVALEEAEKARKAENAHLAASAKARSESQGPFIRKRLGSMSEAERLSFERRNSLRRQSADLLQDLKAARKWSSRENVGQLVKPRSRTTDQLAAKRQESQDSEDISEYQVDHHRAPPQKDDSYDIGSDYTESTASSADDDDSIEKFKQELMARTGSPSPRELETYHPRDMSAGVFTPYRAPTPEQAAVVLTRPMPLPSPDFVPKPILKRSSNENVQQSNSDSNGHDKSDLAKGLKSFFKMGGGGDKRSPTEKNTADNENIQDASSPKPETAATVIARDLEVKRKAKEEEERRRQEAERIMAEESHAAADHYSDLVSQVSRTRAYHTPLYLDRDELKKAAEKAALEGGATDEEEPSRRSPSPDLGLRPPISNKPRLSISERGQMVHVREKPSDLALTAAMVEDRRKEPLAAAPPTPPVTTAPPYEPVSRPPMEPRPALEITPRPVEYATAVDDDLTTTTTTVVSETLEERPDSRGRTRIVKVKRIIKKRVPSSTRSRDASTSRPPSSMSASQQQLDMANYLALQYRMGEMASQVSAAAAAAIEAPPPKTPEQLTEEAHEKVRSAFSYTTDLVLFIVACYVYLFKDARLVLPILALIIYRQLSEVVSNCIPNWLKRKKPAE